MPKKLNASQRATRYQNTLRALKGKYGIGHKGAQAAYREFTSRIGKVSVSSVDVARHPRIARQSVTDGEKRLRRTAREKGKKKTARENNDYIINQAIRELETRSLDVRASIVESSYDRNAGLIKITIRGKDYTRTIKAHIVDRKGSKILQWRWESTTTGKRKNKRRK
jgi:hypothetical protein